MVDSKAAGGKEEVAVGRRERLPAKGVSRILPFHEAKKKTQKKKKTEKVLSNNGL